MALNGSLQPHPCANKQRSHEPRPLTPSPSPDGGEGVRRTGLRRAEAASAAQAGEEDSTRFMVPMRGQHTVEALHGLRSSAFTESGAPVPSGIWQRSMRLRSTRLLVLFALLA